MESTNNDDIHQDESFVRMLTENTIIDKELAHNRGERSTSAVGETLAAKEKRKRKTSATRSPSAPQPPQRQHNLPVLVEDTTSEASGGDAASNASANPDIIHDATSGFSGVMSTPSELSTRHPRIMHLLKRHPRDHGLRHRESWVKNSIYSDAGRAYIVGRVTRFGKTNALLEVQWIDTQFQKKDEYVGINIVQRGIENYSNIMKSPTKPAWRSLCQAERGEIEVEEDASDIEEDTEVEECRTYSPEVVFPLTMTYVESIDNMKFDPEAQLQAPSDLYEHGDDTSQTRIRPEYRHIFEHSPFSSFFAYIPVYFWVEVLRQTNKEMREYERTNRITQRPLFTLQEMMTFLGVLFLHGIGG
ncbi:hypothetical protein PC110_g248 [Phytophthora cactorum]|uniref:PiggyBac transposable element-derived protein domain-containing protein n=1 Tax=Phytophthora cactorum TaxID=29920 RepID=A0A329T1Y9_9STRA|nr:hypothetical protein PC110_g248 [Phytophthora cactorum]